MPRRARPLPAFLVAIALVAGPGAQVAPAGPLGFSDPARLGSGAVDTAAAAISPRGAAVVVTSGRADGSAVLQAMTRGAARAAWRGALSLAVGASQLRDVQAVVTFDDRLLVAWTELTRTRGARVRLADVGEGRPRFVADRPVATPSSAFTRLAVTRYDRVLLAWRDGRRSPSATLNVAVLAPGASRAGATRRLARDVASVALSATGSAATVAWTTSARRPRGPRTLFSMRLRNSGAPRERALLVSHDAAPEIRLAGGADDRAIASWLRPPAPDRPVAAFTRSLQPLVRPARPLVSPDGAAPRRAAALASGPGEQFLAATDTFAITPFGVGVTAWRSRFGGVWVAARPLVGPLAPMAGSPLVVRTADGTGFVIFAQAAPQPSGMPARYDVRVAAAAPDVTPPATTIVGTGLATPDGRGVAAAAGGDHVLVAWPGAGGGVMVVER